MYNFYVYVCKQHRCIRPATGGKVRTDLSLNIERKRADNYISLTGELVKRDLRLKYRRSILGYLWSLLNPLMMMTVMVVVFSYMFRFDIENYALYLICGQTMFNFFNEATNKAMYAVIDNMPKFVMQGAGLPYDNQLYFNALYFPAQAILITVQLIYRPLLVKMANAWADESRRSRFDILIVAIILVCAVIKCESNWNDSAVSGAGAIGLMQMMPSTSAELAESGLVDASSYNPTDLTNPATNIEYGCAYLQQLESQLSSTDEIIAAYNAGPGSVEDWLSGGGDITDVIGFPETALYLTRVNETYDRYQALYTETLSER